MTRDKKPHEIKYLLACRGLTYADIDRTAKLKRGIARTTVRYPHRQGEIAIADALEISPVELWPSRYRADGQRLKPQPRANYRTAPGIPKRQKGARG